MPTIDTEYGDTSVTPTPGGSGKSAKNDTTQLPTGGTTMTQTPPHAQ